MILYDIRYKERIYYKVVLESPFFLILETLSYFRVIIVMKHFLPAIVMSMCNKTSKTYTFYQTFLFIFTYKQINF